MLLNSLSSPFLSFIRLNYRKTLDLNETFLKIPLHLDIAQTYYVKSTTSQYETYFFCVYLGLVQQ